ncbi:hypothetical protein [Pseudolabrys sp. FHR47]|uniref:hypothetical protein n=1 Tax=Pseudolabrys sp. FHR47 TaxID=2562284 RepID=UPI0010BEB767|nr:hypothetical protein [Pseudolabrys sp. FHR47]
MKVAVITLAAVLAASAAQAKLTPFDGAREAKPAEAQTDVVSLYTGPAAAEMERNYFTAPQAANGLPDRCTVSTLVFTKVTLAQACY